MKMTVKRAKLVALFMFLLLFVAGFMGTGVSITVLADTNELIYLLSALACGYLTVLCLQCLIVFADKIVDEK